MEEKKPDTRTINIRLKPVYTLDRDKRVGADISNTNLYLYKNGKITDCPFKAIGTREGVALLPCGEECPHFHFVPETKKVPAKPKEGEETAESVKESFDEYYKLFYKFDNGQAIKFSQDSMDISKMYYKTKYDSKNREASQLHIHGESIFGHLSKIAGSIFELAELRIEMEF